MRKAAQDMQRELNATREELRRGLVEMPDEAREATSTMRKAITEQVEAINELSKIVARYATDAGGTPSAPPPMVDTAARAAAPRAIMPKAEMPEPLPRMREAAPDAYAKPAPAAGAGNGRANLAPPPAPTEGRGRSGSGEGRGWVADLLRRASSDEAPASDEAALNGKRSPAQVVDSLNALSIDIARAIDHEASVELWDRYKKGERNVFTRRLYTLQGQKTFDEIRRKYERDGEFRKAVDNYIGDFERLLAQVSRDDADPSVSRNYLTSDTGKVYTMLAHASGRLT
jgi:hypothetical protein